MSYRKTKLDIIDLQPPNFDNVPWLVEDTTLGHWLGVRPKTLWWLIYEVAELYDTINIPKASGRGHRTLLVPCERLKAVQRSLLTLLLDPLQATLGPHVVAARKGTSLKHTKEIHYRHCDVCVKATEDYESKRHFTTKYNPSHDCVRDGVKLKLDLKDFFPTVRRHWIRDYFHTCVGYNRHISGILASLMTAPFDIKTLHREYTAYIVPQGAPTSAAICNLIADQRIDQPILNYLATWDDAHGYVDVERWRYSRYVDDMYLSHGINLSYDDMQEIYSGIKGIVKESGWKLNYAKTQTQRKGARQHTVGLVMSYNPTVPRKTYNKYRSIIHNIKLHGWESQALRAGMDSPTKFKQHIQGVISMMNVTTSNRASRLKSAFVQLPPLPGGDT